jgi:transglutaminase superfamily protein
MMDGILNLSEDETRALKTAAWAVGIGLIIRLIWHHSAHRQAVPLADRVSRGGVAASERHYRIPIQRGIAGTRKTLEVMAGLVRRDHADVRIRKLAERIVSSCGGHDFDCEISALHGFARDYITFRRDPVDAERVQDCRRCLLSRAGDCDDKSVLLASLLCSLGHRCRFGLLSNKPDDFSHVFVECLSPRGWVALDPTPENAQAGQRGQARYSGSYPIFR